VIINFQDLKKVKSGQTPSPFFGLGGHQGFGHDVMRSEWTAYTVEKVVRETQMIEINCIEATLTHDTSLLKKMDPFVKISSEHFGIKTTVDENGAKTPSWNQRLQIDPTYLGHEVKFSVMD
jgi:hypothetical protein